MSYTESTHIITYCALKLHYQYFYISNELNDYVEYKSCLFIMINPQRIITQFCISASFSSLLWFHSFIALFHSLHQQED